MRKSRAPKPAISTTAIKPSSTLKSVSIVFIHINITNKIFSIAAVVVISVVIIIVTTTLILIVIGVVATFSYSIIIKPR